MKRYRVLGITVALVIIATVLVVVCRPQTPAVNEVRVGVILPLSGPAAYLGTAVKNGMDLALPTARTKLAERKQEVSVVYEDSADQVKDAVSAYNKLTSIDRCNVIVCVSAGWKALIPLADKHQKVLFCTAVSPSKVASQSPWAFRFFTTADLDAALMARFADKHLKLTQVAVVYVNDEFGNSYRDVFADHFTRGGGQIVAAEGVSPAETDFKPVLTRVKATAPEAVYLLGYGSSMALAAKQMRALAITVPLLSIGTISQPDIMKQAGDAVEGTYYTTTQFNTFHPVTPQLTEFVDAYQKKYNQPPIFFEVFGYDSLNMLAAAASSGGTSAQAIRDGLLTLKDYPGAAGNITFSEDGEAVFPVVVRQIRNGELVDVDWVQD